ncbi:hypothetical protein ACLI1A_11205 [Flavobacterium sp. RHBU_3]|uniref:hypothetical protein n=1 Tax=Flavobacterium sp. RHBU_3 TaxID=3391184 RepID=UPI003984C047
MLNKIQQKLLLKYPLLWNTRIVPVVLVSLIVHLLVFITGYAMGGVDFNSGRNKYLDDEIMGAVVFVSTIVALLILIAWLVFYFRNNRTKSFYPLGKNDLYKEWLIIAVICLLNCSYFLSYVTGINTHLKSYMSREEFEHDTEIIAISEIFTGEDNYDDRYYDTVVTIGEDVTYFGKKYSYYSLIHRGIQSFPHYSYKRDSIINRRVKLWFHENREDSVLNVMQEMEKIVKDHGMTMSVTPQEWLKLTYNSPEFIRFSYIDQRDKYAPLYGYENDYNNRYNNFGRYDYSENPIVAENIKTVKEGDSLLISDGPDSTYVNLLINDVKYENGLPYVYPKKYVPHQKLRDAYEKISSAYNYENAYWIAWGAIAFFAVTLASLIFSFRVTSVSSWVIALISLAILAIISTITMILITEVLSVHDNYTGVVYFGFWALLEVVMLINVTTVGAGSKKIKAIMLNASLWLLPWLLPCIIMIAYLSERIMVNYWEERKIDDFLNHNIVTVWGVCLIVYIVLMYLVTRSIKKWRGIAEG